MNVFFWSLIGIFLGSLLVNAPPVGLNFDWTAQVSAYRDVLFDRLAARGYDLRLHLRYAQVLTSLDLQRETSGWLRALMPHRAITAGRLSGGRITGRRMCGDVFRGGSTHPGGGVPMVTLSGKVAAEMVLKTESTE